MGREQRWRLWGPRERRRGAVYHVYPVNDLRGHVLLGGACWCDPASMPLDDGSIQIVHNSADGRELVERHGIN